MSADKKDLPLNPMPLLATEVDAAARELRELVGTSGSKATIRLLRALEQEYLQRLRDVAPEDLLATQASLRQVCAIAQVLAGDATTNGKV